MYYFLICVVFFMSHLNEVDCHDNIHVENITCLDGEPIRFVVPAHPSVNQDSPGVPYIIENDDIASYDGSGCPLNDGGGIERETINIDSDDFYQFSVTRENNCSSVDGSLNTVFVYLPRADQIQSTQDFLLSIECETPDPVLNISVDSVVNVQSAGLNLVSVVDDSTPVVSVAVHRSDTNERIAGDEFVEVGTPIYLTINLTSNPFDGYSQLMVSSIQVKNAQTNPDESLTINILQSGCPVDGNSVFGSNEVLTEDQTLAAGLERQTRSFDAFRYTDDDDEVVFVIQSRICIPTEISQCSPVCVAGRKKRQVDESRTLVSYLTLTVRQASTNEQPNETLRSLSKECTSFVCNISTPVIVGATLGLVVFMIAVITGLTIFVVKKKAFKSKEVVI